MRSAPNPHSSSKKSPLMPWGPSLCGGVRAHLAVHVSFGPDDVVVMVDDHGAAEHMQVLHHVLLGVCQGRDLRVVAWRRGGAM